MIEAENPAPADSSTNIADRCVKCQALLDEEDMFCTECGTGTPHRAAASHADQVLIATHSFDCESCAASMSYDASAQTLRCPFCGSTKLEQRRDEKTTAPNRIVPNAIEKDRALSLLNEWLGQGGFWRPRDLSESAVIAKMTLVYVPYWSFSARTLSFWTADSSELPAGSKGDWRPIAGRHEETYRNMLVGASGALSAEETWELCPFDLASGVPPEQIDLENVLYEQFSLQRKQARPRALRGFETYIRSDCAAHVPGNSRNLKVNTLLEGFSSEAVLVPVWIMAYRYKGELFRFLLNGQTGTATGQAPRSNENLFYAILAALVIAVVIAVISKALR